MRVLVTGAFGFLGRNLTAALEALRDGKDRTRPRCRVTEVMCCGRETPWAELEDFCRRADVLFHLEGVNRPEDPAEFMAVNRDRFGQILARLGGRDVPCTVVLASSVHAARGDSPYGASKRAAEELLAEYGARSGAKTLCYRLPNLFGKWCRPYYNSVAATFCHCGARGLPLPVDDPGAAMELAHVDDVVEEFLRVLTGEERGTVSPVFPVTVGALAETVGGFSLWPLPRLERGSLAEKLFGVWLSNLPPEAALRPLEPHRDGRGSFTELLRTHGGGQLSVNVTLPGAVRGQHWHHSKWEVFFVLSGRGRVRLRPKWGCEVTEFALSGEEPAAVYVLPGYVHSIVNDGDTPLIAAVWADGFFDPNRPDTYFEEV